MMTITKNYLTSDEIAFIVKELLQKETWYEREILKYSLVAQCCINELENHEFKNSNEIYDMIFEDGVGEALDLDIINIDMIDTIIEKETDTPKVVEGFLYRLESKLEEYAKKIDESTINESMKVLVDLMNKKEE